VAPRPRRRRPTARAVELRIRAVRLVVVDLDGVLTDGRVLVDAGGRELRTVHGRDRTGMGLLARAGIPVVVLVPRTLRGLPAWSRNLGVLQVLQGEGRGLESVRRLCRRRRLTLDQVAYVGHDVLELPLLAAVGLAVAVVDAAPPARRAAHWIAAGTGGSGVMREIGERILRLQGKWASTLGETWRQWD
jgi:3-deoxy-D-manno-octulosonate 8-phosphate phosphatase (KDO 8-P phosphatase)